jgi:hypothetical protein
MYLMPHKIIKIQIFQDPQNQLTNQILRNKQNKHKLRNKFSDPKLV